MSRHVLDHDHRAHGSAQVAQYARITRAQMPSRATKMLQRRTPERGDSARIKAFIQIARGRSV